jgi:hypothetical protein
LPNKSITGICRSESKTRSREIIVDKSTTPANRITWRACSSFYLGFVLDVELRLAIYTVVQVCRFYSHGIHFIGEEGCVANLSKRHFLGSAESYVVDRVV